MLLALALSFLQPSGLPGCGTEPRPACFMPEVEDLYFLPQQRKYTWPLEANDPPISVTYHRDPDTYGTLPTSALRNYCLVDEARNTADCYTEWEYQAVVFCSTERWLWIGKNPANQQMLWEAPEFYFEYRNPLRVHMWSFAQRLRTFPSPGAPAADVVFQSDRTQIIRFGAQSPGAIQAMLMIREGDRLFSDSFSWVRRGADATYQGESFGSPSSQYSAAACTGTIIFSSNWCEIAPQRPEC